MKSLIPLASSTSSNSFAAHYRRKRIKIFQKLLDQIAKPSVSILDIGGWEIFWEIMGFAESQHQITLLNLEKYETKRPNITSMLGDARDLSVFPDKSFDVVFSNSVIEHLFTLDDQLKMANEVQRVGKHYFIQTPNFFFPLEPHFLTPFFHWLPRAIRLQLHARFYLGFNKPAGTVAEAQRIVDEIRLLKPSEMKTLFPDATIYRERFFGLTKSLVAIA